MMLRVCDVRSRNTADHIETWRHFYIVIRGYTILDTEKTYGIGKAAIEMADTELESCDLATM